VLCNRSCKDMAYSPYHCARIVKMLISTTPNRRLPLPKGLRSLPDLNTTAFRWPKSPASELAMSSSRYLRLQMLAGAGGRMAQSKDTKPLRGLFNCPLE
jgi:hypothetical protein